MAPLSFFSRLILRLAATLGPWRGTIQITFGVIAFILGFWGWSIKEPAAGWVGHLNHVFLTMQLVALQFPLTAAGEIPWQLQIARIVLPLLAVIASFKVLVASVTRPLSLAWLPRVRDHVIVHGDARITEGALLKLATQGRRIVVAAPQVEASLRDTLESLGLTIVDADPKQISTLKALNVKRAAAVFITGNDDLENLNLAALAVQGSAGRPADMPELILAVLVEREDLASDLDLALDGIARGHRVRYHRLTLAREGLRLELARYAPVLTRANIQEPAHVLILGLSGQWQQTLMQIITSVQDHPDKTSVLSMVLNALEEKQLAHWRALHPDLALVVQFDILIVEQDLLPVGSEISAWRQRRGTPDLVIVLLADTDAVAAALALRRSDNAIGAQNVPALIRQRREDHLLTALGTLKSSDRSLSQIVPFGGLMRNETMERVLYRKGDDLAIGLHAHYLDAAQSSAVDPARTLASWDNLTDNLREANRAAASHAAVLFAALGLRITDKSENAEPVSPGADEIETLARIEHKRWVCDRIEHGWRSGALRDDARLIHSSIVDFASLPEAEKEKNRATVRALVAVLAQSGQILTKARHDGA